MYKVLILMSTYNGKNKIRKQVESIIQQKDVDSYICIRDDGSDNETIEVIENLAQEYCGRIFVMKENNVGWKQSFLNLVYEADNIYDYYGFSDQDDICLLIMERIKSENKLRALYNKKMLTVIFVSETMDLTMKRLK